MFDRLLEINSAISKALIDIEQKDVFDNIKFETIIVITADLKPVKIGFEKLCSRNETLLSDVGIFVFVIREWNNKTQNFLRISNVLISLKI